MSLVIEVEVKTCLNLCRKFMGKVLNGSKLSVPVLWKTGFPSVKKSNESSVQGSLSEGL